MTNNMKVGSLVRLNLAGKRWLCHKSFSLPHWKTQLITNGNAIGVVREATTNTILVEWANKQTIWFFKRHFVVV
jgi:hypothetical protein